MAQLECKNLTLGYGTKTVIENLSFSVNKGDYLCIVGENGSGKTTLMKTILRLQKPLEGQITTGDGVLPDEIGYLPQQTQVQRDFPASVWEIVLSGCQSRCGKRPFYNKEDKKKALEVLEILKIKDLKKKIFSELSGGQRQKVLLARSLCATDKLLILDEPSNNLDQKSKSEFYTTLKHLYEGHGIYIMMITHDIDNDSLIGNKVLALSTDGYYFGKTDDYLEANI